MIEIPTCLYCEKVKKGMKCDAFPDGIPSDELYKHRKNHEECNNGITFEKHSSK